MDESNQIKYDDRIGRLLGRDQDATSLSTAMTINELFELRAAQASLELSNAGILVDHIGHI